MDLGTLIIVAISIAIFALPFIYFRSKGKKSKAYAEMNAHASNRGYELTEVEADINIVLGMDGNKRIAFFSNILIDDGKIQEVDLSKMSMCKVDRKVRTFKEGEGVESVTESIQLCFTPKSKKDESQCFLLFDENVNVRLGNELMLANKWADVYNRRIK